MNLLVGVRFLSVGRALDLVIFSFAPKDGPPESVRLHVKCPCRIRHREWLLLGAGDLAYFNADQQTLFDRRAAKLNEILDCHQVEVEGVKCGPAGSLALDFADEFKIEAFPYSSKKVEAWRVLRVGGEHLGYPEDLI
ncbi:hypothetical protein I6A84_24080 [Frankia sp. CNm7]|uniref:Uncharacterized protein n=1 Tax=Frankia nepalensis TaxID=1836974 RepID=A0A937URX0_9ACTN|nr:hypothetical protein [Frankia nepalensis]MBL7495835.1 hypothetical protein [Frankia nepalensis]MBL7509911.1 hypothetical protein [Frankia nepalensis]MBL7521083.1 hypothetical protein [Frankia nepalensis]MBL7629670.1 hypothetical protein [Frankia nepalensis]